MKKLSIPLILLAILTGCRDLIEVNLAKERVYILAPANNTISSSYSIQFIWEEVEGADHYQLQVVKPDFSAIQQYLLDTNIRTTKFNFTLQPGNYQWRVRAVNGSSETPFSTNNLTIDSTLDLSGQQPALTSPEDNYYSNISAQTFTWQTMPNANNYIFQVLSSGTIIHTASTTTLSSNYTFVAEGNYQWRVFAQNSSSGSGYTSRNITIDNTDPIAPTLLTPLANDTTSNPVLLSWDSDNLIISDSVYIYADTNLTILTISDLTTTESYSFSGTAGQDYFWRVKSKDAAGNWGPFSIRRKFIINP